MNSSRSPFYFVTVLLIGAFVFIVIQQNIIKRLTKEIAMLRVEASEAKKLRAENAGLIGDLKDSADRIEPERRELLRLRGQVAALRDKENEIATLKSERERMKQQLQNAPRVSIDAPAPEETQERRRTIARLSFSKQLGLSLILAAADNQAQLPSNLEALEGKYLRRTAEMDEHNIQIGQFELLYGGRLSDGPDPRRTVLAREKEPIQRTDGKWEQVYVFVDGHAEVLSALSREQLAQREKEQFIIPTKP